ncbi:MAG: arginine--tRNA ligase, partial [Halobacteriovoraceae bacterium]|nr:arginine--tRNA ligase [Halobacteriovoraceae bacterium]
EKYLSDDSAHEKWSQEEVDRTARMIAGGAIKYGMVRVDNNRKIVFDMKEWLKLDGETGPYLQYVHARIHSLCNKLGYREEMPVNWELLKEESETALMVKLMDFNQTVATGVQKLQTLGVCNYLFELGKLFNSFYAECPIGKAEEELKHTRLALAHATGEVMREGLSLLGIEAPTKM